MGMAAQNIVTKFVTIGGGALSKKYHLTKRTKNDTLNNA
jgi:hypothetical protein